MVLKKSTSTSPVFLSTSASIQWSFNSNKGRETLVNCLTIAFPHNTTLHIGTHGHNFVEFYLCMLRERSKSLNLNDFTNSAAYLVQRARYVNNKSILSFVE
jgi:hypothetical protein